MTREIPLGCQWWPENSGEKSPDEIVRMYQDGFAGAWRDVQADRVWAANVQQNGGRSKAHEAFALSGIRGTGAGGLWLLFPAIEELYPGALPGPAQERGDCFVAGTTVLGDYTKPIEDVQIGDIVWTGEGKTTKVVSKRAMETMKPLVKIKCRGGMPITCTSDHRFLVYRLGKSGSVTINPKSYAAALTNAAKSKSKSDIVTRYEARNAEWVSAAELKDSDCLLTPLAFEGVNAPSDFTELTTSDEGMFFLGFFLGNGHASGHSVELTTAKKHFLEKISCFLRSRQYITSIGPQRGAFRLRLNCASLVRWMRSHFYDAGKVKKFPGWAVGNKSFIDGLIAADGHVQRGRVFGLDSTSKSIVFGAYASLVSLGCDPCVNLVSRSKGTYPNAKPLWRLNWRINKKRDLTWRDENFLCRAVVSVEYIEGPSVVYDIGVEDSHHSFIANGVVVHNCVSHSSRNAALASLCNEIVSGKPDEITGKTEGAPEVPAVGVKNGVLSSEYLYWWRGYDGDGWDCSTAADMIVANGMLLRQNYMELGIDLTKYTGRLAGKYGRTKPPAAIMQEGQLHPVRTTTKCDTWLEILDALANGYGVSSCGSEGFESTRNEDGLSRRSGSWAHAMAYLGADDRAETRQKYGEGLALVANSWGAWNSGPKRIRGTNIDIPDGCFWARWSDIKNRSAIAYSSVAGWPRKKLTNYGFSVFG